MVFIQDMFYNDPGADAKTAAPFSFFPFLRKNRIREISLVLFIWKHHGRIRRGDLANDGSLWNDVPFFTLVFLAVLVQDISCRSLFLGEDFALHLGDHDLKIVVHGVLLISVTVTLIILRSSTNGN